MDGYWLVKVGLAAICRVGRFETGYQM